MKLLRTRSPGRIAMMLMFSGLLLTVCLAMVWLLERRLRPLAPRVASGELTPEALNAELSVLLVILLGSILLILIFVIGAYLLIRAGRAVSAKRVGGQPTECVDAWSQYRMSDEQIEAATREDGNDRPAEPDTDDDLSEPPPDPPGGTS